MKSHASMNSVSTIAIPKLGCGVDQMNWQEVLKVLGDVFAYADVQLVLYTLEENEFTGCPLRETLNSMLMMK